MSFQSRLLSSKLDRPVSLRSNLVVLVLAAIMPLLIFAVAMVVRSSQEERKTFRRGATERTLALMTAVDSRLHASVTSLEALATSDHIDSGDLQAFYEEATRVLRTQPDWFTINLATLSGQHIVNVIFPYGIRLPTVAERVSFDEAVRNRKPVVGSLQFNEFAGQHLFRVRVPVVRDGVTKYILSAAVTTHAIEELLTAQNIPSDWAAMVLDQNARILARTINPHSSVGKLASESIRSALNRAPEGWSKITTLEGSPAYLPYHRSAFSGWTMAMGVPAAAVDAQFRRSLIDIASFGLIFLAAGIAMAWVLSNRTAKWIASLASIAEDLGLGEEGGTAAEPSGSADAVPTRIAEVEDVRESLLRAGRLIRERSEERDRVEAALRGVTERFELAQEAANIGAFERDLQTGSVTWSPSQEILYGLKPGSFEGTYEDWKKRVHPDDAADIDVALRRSTEAVSPFQLQFRIVRPDGSVRWIESQARVFADQHGRPSRVIGINIDITNKKRAEQRLRVQVAVHRVLAESPAPGEAAKKLLRVLCETAEWDVSALWCIDEAAKDIGCAEVWHRPLFQAREFAAATRNTRFACGRSLVGSVWQSGEPLWMTDVTTDPLFARAPEALKDGLHAGVCFPIKLGAEVLGVMECFSRETREADEDFLRMLPAIGGQIGQFIRRKRAEEELRESEERLRAVVDTAVDGIITIDERGIIATVNPAAEHIFGYTAAEMIGQNVRLIMPDPYHSAHDRYIADYLRTGERKIIGSKREVPGRRKDGTTFPLELGVSESRLRNQRIFTGLMRDVTERQLAAEALTEQARLLDLSKDAILVRDTHDRILYWSRGAEELYGWPHEEAIGQVAHQLLQTEFTEPLEQINAQLHLENRWSGDLIHRRRDGARIYVSTRWVLDRDSQGQPTSVLETNTDITERKSAEAALREADRRKDEFLAMLGHELRNPLGVISNTVHLLRWNGAPEPPLELHNIIERQVAHMSELVDDLLDVSRISRGHIALTRERCDLTAITRSTAEDYRGTMERSGLQLELDTPDYPLWVMGDRTRLAQILGNLLHNAEKFTGSGGRVTVRLAEDSGNSATLVVRDTGIGMQADILERAFEPFSQSDRTLDRRAGGLGLGLALVKGLVESHGGRVDAHSDGPGRGAEFAVQLPLTQAPSCVNTAGIKPRSDGACTRRILIIEDNLVGARTMRMYLTRVGHQVEEAHSGMEAIEAARRFGPEVVLCDIGLPGMDGYAVARALRQELGLTEAYMIAISGYGQEEDKRRSFEAGFDMHLTKPADLKKLKELLSRPIIRDTALAV
jgi:PAS domain S-box-containing protein